MQIILIRHGEIQSNLNHFYSGRSAEPLTERGIEQAREVATRLQGREVEAVYSSPLRRTMETAKIISAALGRDVCPEDALNEMIMGPWERRTEEDIAREYPNEWALWNSRPADLAIPGRETLADLERRIVALFRRLLRHHQGTVVLVTHFAIVRVALLHLRGEDLNRYKSIHVPNCEPVEVEVTDANLRA